MTAAKDALELVRPDDTVLDAAIASVRKRLKRVRRLYSRAVAKPDAPESMHRLRVATRRATEAIGLYSEFLPRRRAKRMEKRLKKIRRKAGAVRDDDVLLARFTLDHPEEHAPRFIEGLRDRRAQSARKLVAFYRKKGGARRLKRKTSRLLRACRSGGARCAPASEQRFGDWAPRPLESIVADFFVASSPDFNDLPMLHRFRIRAKSLRYAMELLMPAFAPEFRTELYPAVEHLQDLLGSINDEANFLRTVGAQLSETAEASDIAGLTHRMAQEQRVLEDLRRQLAGWWTRERCEELNRRFDELLATSTWTAP